MKVTFTGPGAPAALGRARPGPGPRLTPRLPRAPGPARPRCGTGRHPEPRGPAPLRPPASAASAAPGPPGAFPKREGARGPGTTPRQERSPRAAGARSRRGARPGRSAGLAPGRTSRPSCRNRLGSPPRPQPRSHRPPRPLRRQLRAPVPERERWVRTAAPGILGTGIPGAAARPALPPQAPARFLTGALLRLGGPAVAGCRLLLLGALRGRHGGRRHLARSDDHGPAEGQRRPPAHVVRPRRRYGARQGPTPARRQRLKGAAPAAARTARRARLRSGPPGPAQSGPSRPRSAPLGPAALGVRPRETPPKARGRSPAPGVPPDAARAPCSAGSPAVPLARGQSRERAVRAVRARPPRSIAPRRAGTAPDTAPDTARAGFGLEGTPGPTPCRGHGHLPTAQAAPSPAVPNGLCSFKQESAAMHGNVGKIFNCNK